MKIKQSTPDETETKKEIHSRILQNKDEDNSITVHYLLLRQLAVH